ncbi:unnamed protein product [Macrosiphum euphorbiae]|uniref:Uncharacterized protein n=1 Tax=Macrosiphum euphorbiae TaxID=13131 RepID=A0AAV0X1X0_9HEMI|nr:unnamed protein product [Macrosiphum euphorbiae]
MARATYQTIESSVVVENQTIPLWLKRLAPFEGIDENQAGPLKNFGNGGGGNANNSAATQHGGGTDEYNSRSIKVCGVSTYVWPAPPQWKIHK